MATELRHTTFDTQNPEGLSAQLSENALDTNQALRERIVGRRVAVSAYSATGATTTAVTLRAQGIVQPFAVMLVRAYPTSDPGADVAITGRVNFRQQGETLFVFEPAGLVANTLYDLTFLVLE